VETEEREVDFLQVVGDLIVEATASTNQPRVVLYVRELITLKDLFVYPVSPEGVLNGLDMFWPEAERTLQQELEFYELIARNSVPSETEDMSAMIERSCIM